MCLTSLTTCHSIHATAPNTRWDARYKCFEVANYGGVRTRYTRQLIGGSWWHYRPPRKHNLGGREDVKAHSPRALLLFWHGATAAVDNAAVRAGYTVAANGRHDIPSTTRCATPFMASIARTSFPDSLPSFFFSADESRCAAHVDSLTLHDTIRIDLWSFFFLFLSEQQRIVRRKVIFSITYVQLGFVSGAITCAVCYMLYWLRGREGKATGFPLPFSKDDLSTAITANCLNKALQLTWPLQCSGWNCRW